MEPSRDAKGDIVSDFASEKGSFGWDQTADSIRPAAYAKDGGGQFNGLCLPFVNKETFSLSVSGLPWRSG